MSKIFPTIFVFFLAFSQIAFSAPELEFELITKLKLPNIILKNNTTERIVLPNNLRGQEILCLVIHETGILVQDKRWPKKELKNKELWGGGLTYSLKSQETLEFVPVSECFFDFTKNGNNFLFCIIRNIPISKTELRISNPIKFTTKAGLIVRSEKIDRSIIPDNVIAVFNKEIEILKNQ